MTEFNSSVYSFSFDLFEISIAISWASLFIVILSLLSSEIDFISKEPFLGCLEEISTFSLNFGGFLMNYLELIMSTSSRADLGWLNEFLESSDLLSLTE